MLKRYIEANVKNSIETWPAVALLGPRQIGKTTLAKNIAAEYDSIYLDLESPEDLLKLSDPLGYLTLNKDKLIILDEIQRAPNLFNILRGVIDKNRQEGKKSAQFLLLGSASIDLLRQSSESLAGRIKYINMHGFNIFEADEINKLWLRGGFPESYLAASDEQAFDWLEMFIRTYLERDVPQMGFRVPAVRLRRLWTMIAHLQGENINHSKLGGNLEVDSKTITHYLDILVDLLLVTKLDPWHENVKKRMVKSPRYYIKDSGILHRLLGIFNYDDLISNPILGKSREGFVIENIQSILPSYVEKYYYRTSAGIEIDLILKFSATQIWAIEIKHGLNPTIKSSFHQAAEDVKAVKKFIIYGGKDRFAIKNDTEIISLQKFMTAVEGQIANKES